jgi:hypothetical protein
LRLVDEARDHVTQCHDADDFHSTINHIDPVGYP